jgi:hypothetical protein
LSPQPGLRSFKLRWHIDEIERSEFLDRYVRNLRRWRSLPQPLNQRVYFRRAAHGQYFDATVSKVFCIAGNTQSARLLLRTGSKEYALHPTRNETMFDDEHG